MGSSDGNEFRESEWRRLLGLLDARAATRKSNVAGNAPAGTVLDTALSLPSASFRIERVLSLPASFPAGDLIDLEAERKKRADAAPDREHRCLSSSRPQSSGGEEPRRKEE